MRDLFKYFLANTRYLLWVSEDEAIQELWNGEVVEGVPGVHDGGIVTQTLGEHLYGWVEVVDEGLELPEGALLGAGVQRVPGLRVIGRLHLQPQL